MKRLALITAFFPPDVGGIETYLEHFVRWYEGEIILITPNKTVSNLPKNVTHIPMRFFAPRPAFPSWLPFIFRLRRILRTHRIEHIVLGHIGPYMPGIAVLASRMKLPWSTFLHGNDFLQWERRAFRRMIRNRSLCTATHVIANGTFLASAAVSAGVSQKRVLIVSPGTDDTVYYQERPKRFFSENDILGHPVVLSVGRLVARKGFDTSVRAFAEVLRRVPNAVFVIIGDGPERAQLMALTEQLSCGHAVRFLGVITDPAIKRKWYSSAECFVMPTRTVHGWDTESFGIVYVEALACGTPVIAARSGGVGDIVQHGVNGFLATGSENSSEIAHFMEELLISPEKRSVLAAHARRSVIPRFTWENQFQKLTLLWTSA